MTKHLSRVLVALSALALSTTLAHGDVAQVRDGQPPKIPSANAIPEKIAPPLDDTTGSSETLSERLDRSGGVIRPPRDVDPGMSVSPPVPDPGTTKVIPPPGSPGGDPSVRPK